MLHKEARDFDITISVNLKLKFLNTHKRDSQVCF